MQAALTLPTGMTTIPTSMSKITKNVYFQDSTKNFYKITVLQPMTMFTNNDAVTRQNIVMTRYDPAYLALGLLEQNPKMSTYSIPKYLTFANFQPFVDVDVDVDQMGSNGLNAIGNGSVSIVNNANGYWMRANIQKIMDFLEKRIDNMVRVI